MIKNLDVEKHIATTVAIDILGHIVNEGIKDFECQFSHKNIQVGSQ